ncbi:MAG: hypothetical protein Q4D56_14735 [Bacteroides sp.]|nr:hypothetical protein [Bacteroides sp.]
MKTFTLFLTYLFVTLLPASPQTAGTLLNKMSEALAAGQNDYAVSLFRQAAQSNADETEMYYWTEINKSGDLVPRLAQELAVYYKGVRNYDKAYLFYRELLQRRPDDVSALVSCAEVQLMRDKEKDAMKLYEKVLTLDNDNLQANIFLGNYYYLQAEKAKKKLDDDYKKLTSPTKMQYARYRNGLSDVYSNSYAKAKNYLQRVLQLFPSNEAGKTLEKIRKVEKEVRQ